MGTAGEYLKNAVECERLAEAARRGPRQTFLCIATHWRSLAEEAKAELKAGAIGSIAGNLEIGSGY
jgi:predicted dehydrogenase